MLSVFIECGVFVGLFLNKSYYLLFYEITHAALIDIKKRLKKLIYRFFFDNTPTIKSISQAAMIVTPPMGAKFTRVGISNNTEK